ncbi:MAG: transcriptional regulator [Flavobacteriales bacterium]|nr:transcriptional regulator [Flavobacteriales bacterium]
MAKKGRLTKAERERLQEHAKLLFTRDNITVQKELAERVGVSEKTMGEWIEEGGWKKLKRNFILTREEQLANLLDELTELNEAIKKKKEGTRFADSKEANVRRFLIRDIKDLETKALLPELISALTQLLDFVRKNDLGDAQMISKYVDSFIKTKLR